MKPLQFDNAFLRELPADRESGLRLREVHGALYSLVAPQPVAAPRLLAWSAEAAALLDWSSTDIESAEFLQVFAGNALLAGMQPWAANYGGHQFGQWAGQLGDGRAISLGEVINSRGERWELQLKGAGPTPYSRHADGRAVLRSSLREFLCSEAMFHLGVPTTRALSLIGSGESVVRDMFYDGNPRPEPGAILCRLAPSFIRFGSFELPASRADLPLLQRLLDFTIQRDFPELAARASGENLRELWFAEVCRRTAIMVGHWMRVGFVHGVMNTDNMSILGLTIDYGPYGWIDNYDPDWTPNTTDRERRRYRFGQQAQVAYWNLGQLAQALLPAFSSAEPLQAGLQLYMDSWTVVDRDNTARKLGLLECRDEDLALMADLQGLLQQGDIDMTIFFRNLADMDAAAPTLAFAEAAFYDVDKRHLIAADLNEWLLRYAQRLASDDGSAEHRRIRMNAANPRFVLRNYLAQQAIDRAEQGDVAAIAELLEVLRRPYQEQLGQESYAQRRPEWARNRAGCSMLSCSS